MFHKFPLNITYGTLVAMETLGEENKYSKKKRKNNKETVINGTTRLRENKMETVGQRNL